MAARGARAADWNIPPKNNGLRGYFLLLNSTMAGITVTAVLLPAVASAGSHHVRQPAPLPSARTAQMTTTSDVRGLSSSISVITSADGESIVQGTALKISWQTSNAPAGSAVALMPEKALTGHIFDPIATALPTGGSYTWHVPIFVNEPIPCAPDLTGGCIGSMNPTTYKIVARLYTPADASLTEFGPGKTHPIWITWTESREFTMLAASVGPTK